MRLSIVAVCLVLASSASAQTTQDKSFESNGVRIRYIDQGAGDPVLLIHGYTRSVETNWISTGVVENLAKDHRVIAFDLRGHGKSEKPHDPNAYGGELAQDAIRLLDHLKIRRADIVGYSLGAGIALKLVTIHPERFRTLTLGGAAGYRNWRPEYDLSAQRAAQELEGDVPFRGLVIAMTPSDEPKRTEEEIRARSDALVAANDVVALAAYQRKGLREINTTDAEVAAIRVPVLGLIGSLDGGLRGMQQLQTILPSLKLVVIEGATHVGDRMAAARPEFVGAIRDFIAAHRSPVDTAAILATARPEIEAANAAWLPGLKSHDAASVAAAYADSGLFILPDGSVIRGRAAVAAMYTARFQRQRPIRAGGIVQDGISVAGAALVFEWGHGWVEMEPQAAGGPPVRSGGTYLTVWQRSADGHWRIVRNLSF